MNDYIYFKEKLNLSYKKILASGINLDKIRPYMVSFINYMSGDFDTKILDYEKDIQGIKSIKLEDIVSVKYKFLVKGVELRNVVTYVADIEKRMGEFKGKENNLEIMIEFYFLFYLLVTKLVEVYVGSLAAYKKADPNFNASSLTLDNIGIDNSILKYYLLIEDIRTKTIDDWLKINMGVAEARYLTSAIKRVLVIFGASDK